MYQSSESSSGGGGGGGGGTTSNKLSPGNAQIRSSSHGGNIKFNLL